MKRIKNRTFSALLIAAAVLLGMFVYIVKYFANGDEWVSFASNAMVYQGGVLSVGTIFDRNGVVLAGITDGGRTFAEDKGIRKATLHAVGDATGNIGTGALSAFASRLMGYNIVSGAYSRSGQGEELYLTIDANLNEVAYNALDGRKGTVGVVNYKTGEILCMVSSPTYDPADPPEISEGDTAYEGVYLNRFLSSTFTPGSIFKLVTTAAAIENIDDLYDRVFTCEGSLKVGGNTVMCTDVHGELTIEDALAVSCNSAFGQLALELGADKLERYADKYGLLSAGSVDGLKTAAGNFDQAPDKTADLAWSGIGQFNDTVCPASMLRFVGAIANGGLAVDMSLLKDRGLSAVIPPSSERMMSRDTAEKLATMMNYNVHKTYGEDNFPGLELYAKSGTAEVGGNAAPHAWFTGYITNEETPLAFIVLVENGGSGRHTAGAVANAVLQAAVSNESSKG
jgi:cell division protein FtsI/penicillin-binding protein 2